MSAGVIIAYDTEKLSFKCYMITSGLKVAISHLKKMAFFHGLLREFMIECVGTLYPVRCVPDSWLCPRGQRRTIKINKLASLFWKTKYFTCLFRDIYIYPGFLKGLICLIFHFTGLMHLSHWLFVLILPFPRVLHYTSLAEKPWPQVLLKMMNMCLLT